MLIIRVNVLIDLWVYDKIYERQALLTAAILA